MQRLFISDLHLTSPQADAFLRLGELLRLESQRVDEIYILGDLVEMWVGDDDDSAGAVALQEILKSTAAHCPVYVMHGNRDFLFGEGFALHSGARLITDPFCTADGLLLCHGDSLCIDDQAYQAMRATLRSAAWQADILAKTLAERKAFGEALRAQSKNSNANKPGNIMDVNLLECEKLVAAYGAHTLIHGHTHRPGIHQHTNFVRYVTGAWERCGWLCRQDNRTFSMECFSLGRHYGT